MNHPKILAITKRIGELGGTQSLLYRAGFDLVTATSMVVARSVIKAIRVRGVIVCLDSWSSQERECIVAELAATQPEIEVIVRCPGCTKCDDAPNSSGAVSDIVPLTQLMMAIAPATKK